MDDTESLLREVARVASTHGRQDLATALVSACDLRSAPQCRVVVCGEFKVGKSRFVNALVNADVCRPDAEIATARPVAVTYGETIVESPVRNPDGEVVGTTVTVPRKLLADGLVLVDTPGVGRGLANAHTTATLLALAQADAVLFVTDAAKEVSAAEVEFVERALTICPAILCVVSKIDYYPEWQRIVAADRLHFAGAGIDIDIFPVSSAMRQRAIADRDGALHERSGFVELVAALRARALHDRIERIDADTLGLARTALDQLCATLRAEEEVLSSPDDSLIVKRLREAEQRADELAGVSSTWQQTLARRAEDLQSAADADLSGRLLAIRGEVTERVNAGVPAAIWPDLEPWLFRRANEELLDHFGFVRRESESMASAVLDLFGEDADRVAVTVAAPDRHSSRTTLTTPPRRTSLVEAGVYAARGPTLGVTAAHTLVAVLGVSTLIALPVTAVLGAAIGRRTWNSARTNQLQAARAEMLRAIHAYLDEFAVTARKESRDALRGTERALRDELASIAVELHRTAVAAREAAASDLRTDHHQRAQRGRVVVEALSEIAELGNRVAAITT